MFDLYNGDCLEIMRDIPDDSIDLILCDPPYGTMKGQGKSPAAKSLGLDNCDWDEALPTGKMFSELSRVLRQNGKAILFSQEPYTSELITTTIPSLPFSYRALWLKNTSGNPLKCNKAMLCRYEDIVIFSKILEENKKDNPVVSLMVESLTKNNKTISDAIKLVGSSASHYFTSGKQFRIPTRDKFETLKSAGFFDFEYSAIKEKYDKYNIDNLTDRNKKYPSVFNLWQGGKSKSNVLEYAKDNDGYHPTQKPILLLEDLIKTYSNAGDTILDFTMGSGSTGVACANTGRKFIGIELDPKYYAIAEERIRNAFKSV
jgi:site-specific DNA-methyltransferase (adenine-specific)